MAAERTEHAFTDASDVTIHFYRWSASQPKGVVQIVHGLGEHALRYEYVAQALVRAGFSVYANDQRGHGATGLGQYEGDHGRLGRLGPGGLRGTIAANARFSELIASENPDLPLFLLGHSWGSLMAQMMLNADSRPYRGVILTGTAYRMPGYMDSGDLTRKHRVPGGNGFEWLSRDEQIQRAAAADALMFPAEVLRLFGVRDGLRLFGRPRRNAAHDIPVLIAVGDDDTLGGRRSAERLGRAYRERSGLTDVEVAVYPGARHEVLSETNKDEVIADVVAWLNEHIEKARG